MTQIKVKEDGSCFSISFDGHAAFSESGTDIVCSAISILSYAFSETCLQLDAEKLVNVERLDMRMGFMSISVVDGRNCLLNAKRMLRNGLEALETQYPENVHIQWGES